MFDCQEKKITNLAVFNLNEVEGITIGSDALLHKTSFDNGFAAFYNRNGKKVGTYIFSNGAWSIL
jgi:hypothetical protein